MTQDVCLDTELMERFQGCQGGFRSQVVPRTGHGHSSAVKGLYGRRLGRGAEIAQVSQDRNSSFRGGLFAN